MKTLKEVMEIMRNRYVAATGLGRLPDWDTDTSIAPNGVESVRNENGILYRAFAVVQALRAGGGLYMGELRALAETLVSLRRLPDDAGLHNRQPGLNTRTEAHDNQVGISAICVILGDEETPNAMIRHFWRNKGCFNNVNPGKFSITEFRQPGEVTLYYIAAGRRAPFLFMLWTLAGIFINAKSKKIDAAQARLTWLRHWIISKKDIKGFVQRWLYKQVLKYWWKRTNEKYGSEAGILSWGPDHPVTLFQQIIDSKKTNS